MKITPTTNHGKTRWRLNVQQRGYRKRLFFETREEAAAFANATGGHFTYGNPVLRSRPSPSSYRTP
jgi:hypothetical protein